MTDGYDPDCPFCEIAHREDRDAREVYRDSGVVAFFPTEPAVLGHTLVVPRRHVVDIWALEDPLASQLAAVTLRVAKAIRMSVNPDGLNVIQSNGPAASQTINHLHVHVVPRWEGDRIGTIWPPESNYSEAQKDNAWDAIREACADLSSGATPKPESRLQPEQ
jgi:histidine triad (HIT) family protein